MKKITRNLFLLPNLFFISGAYANDLDNKYLNLSDKVEMERYSTNLRTFAIERKPGSENHTFVRETLIARLKELAYDVTEDKYETGINIVARKKGQTLPNEEILVSAHYDSDNNSTLLPVCYGADDNASGIAAALEVATVLAQSTFDRTLTIIFWDEEEAGLVGSKSYVARHNKDNIKTKMMFSLETMGYANSGENTQTLPLGFAFIFPLQYNQVLANGSRGDFVSVSADDSEISKLSVSLMEEVAQRENLPAVTVQLLPEQKNNIMFRDFSRSDHASFWEKDIPAMIVSDTANFRNENYHCMLDKQDSVDTINYNFATKVTKIVAYTAANLLQLSQTHD